MFCCGIFTKFIINYIEIKSDVFDIVKRIKSIDKKYFVVYNFVRKKFEVHYKRNKNDYELTIPYTSLDARAVEFVRKTRIENRKKLFEEIEKTNEQLEKNETKKTIENINRRIYESK